jgi:hypothetical protein
VSVGIPYEYQIVKHATLGYTGYGYIYSGIEVPLTETRGKLLLIVATNNTASLSNELARLRSDLVGDGWTVLRQNVSSADSPAYVRGLITNTYYADPANVNCVFLFGHVPILQSGNNLNYDGHLIRPMPADSFYAEMNNDWPTDPGLTPDFLPSDVKLMIGRVDLFDMPGSGAAVPWPGETELLRRYLNKDHNWRHKLITAQRRALMGNLRGDENGEATATSGYRNFAPLVGLGNTVEANVEYEAPPDQRWISFLAKTNWLLAYGCGAGLPSSISGLGTNDGTAATVHSTDIVGQDAKAAIVMLFGSWFGNWDFTDDIMRSVLATPTMGLACCMAGRPHWFLHHMGLGEPIGFSTRLSMNNSSLYQNQSNGFTRAIYVALMGDPALRLDAVAPPTQLIGIAGTNGVQLQWTPSTDAILGYHIYRALAPDGPFTRLTPSLTTATNFSDSSLSAPTYTYMVKAIKLQTTPSGTYFNASQGAFVTVSNLQPAIQLSVSKSSDSILLSWNSQSGLTYRIQSRTDALFGTWFDLASNLGATGPVTIWSDSSASGHSSRFYRVVLP